MVNRDECESMGNAGCFQRGSTTLASKYRRARSTCGARRSMRMDRMAGNVAQIRPRVGVGSPLQNGPMNRRPLTALPMVPIRAQKASFYTVGRCHEPILIRRPRSSCRYHRAQPFYTPLRGPWNRGLPWNNRFCGVLWNRLRQSDDGSCGGHLVASVATCKAKRGGSSPWRLPSPARLPPPVCPLSPLVRTA